MPDIHVSVDVRQPLPPVIDVDAVLSVLPVKDVEADPFYDAKHCCVIIRKEPSKSFPVTLPNHLPKLPHLSKEDKKRLVEFEQRIISNDHIVMKLDHDWVEVQHVRTLQVLSIYVMPSSISHGNCLVWSKHHHRYPHNWK
jgi:hypothetical protein